MFRAVLSSRIGAIGFAALLCATPGRALAETPTHTGRSACVWNHLSDGLRTELLAIEAARGAPDAVIAAHQGELAGASRACGLESTIATQPLFDFALLRGQDQRLTAINISGDDVERRFLALENGVDQQFIKITIAGSAASEQETQLRATVAEVIAHQVGASDAGAGLVARYLTPLARVLYNDKYLWLAGKPHQGAVDCVYDRLPLVVRNAAFFLARDGKSLDAWRTQYGAEVETASRACFLPGPMSTRGIGLRAAMLAAWVRPAPAGVAISNVVFSLSALPDATQKRLRDLLNSNQQLSTADNDWLNATLAAVLDAGHYTDPQARTDATTWLVDTIRIDRMEGVA